MIDYKRTGEEIKKRRESMHITQAKLATGADISGRYITMIENGHAGNISLNVFDSIATYFRCDPKDLIITTDQNGTDNYDNDNDFNLDDCIAAANYRYRNPYRKISTFAELFLAIPLLNYADLLEGCRRVSGEIFGAEDYMSQIIDKAWCHVQPSPAKDYVERILTLIRAEPWANSTDNPSQSLHDTYGELYASDTSLQSQHDAYINLVHKKRDIANIHNRLAALNRSVTTYSYDSGVRDKSTLVPNIVNTGGVQNE